MGHGAGQTDNPANSWTSGAVTVASTIRLYTSSPSGSAALADDLDLIISTSPVASTWEARNT